MQIRIETYVKHEPSYLNEIHELQEQVRHLEIELDDLKVRKDVLDNKLKNQIEVNALQDEEKNDYTQKLGRSENENKVLRHQILSLKQSIEQQEESQNQQFTEMSKELDQMRNKERDYFNKQVFQERENDQLKDENRRQRKELEQVKGDLEQTIKMMENYESRLQLFQKRDENQLKTLKDLKEKCETAQLERDRYVLKEEQHESTLNNLLLKSQEDLQILKEANEKSLDQLKNRYKGLLEARDDDINRLNEDLTQNQLLLEKLQKENKSLKQEIGRMESGLIKDIEGNNQQTDDLLRQVNELQEKVQILEQQHIDNETHQHAEKQQMEQQLRIAQNSNADLRQALEHTRSQLTSTSQELSSIKGKITQQTRQTQNLIEELGRTKKFYEQRLEQLQDEHAYKIKNIQTQLDDAVKREKSSRERAVQLLQQYDQIEEKLKSEYSARIQELEYQLNQLRSQNKALSIKLTEMRSQLGSEGGQVYGTIRK